MMHSGIAYSVLRFACFLAKLMHRRTLGTRCYQCSFHFATKAALRKHTDIRLGISSSDIIYKIMCYSWQQQQLNMPVTKEGTSLKLMLLCILCLVSFILGHKRKRVSVMQWVVAFANKFKVSILPCPSTSKASLWKFVKSLSLILKDYRCKWMLKRTWSKPSPLNYWQRSTKQPDLDAWTIICLYTKNKTVNTSFAYIWTSTNQNFHRFSWSITINASYKKLRVSKLFNKEQFCNNSGLKMMTFFRIEMPLLPPMYTCVVFLLHLSKS